MNLCPGTWDMGHIPNLWGLFKTTVTSMNYHDWWDQGIPSPSPSIKAMTIRGAKRPHRLRRKPWAKPDSSPAEVARRWIAYLKMGCPSKMATFLKWWDFGGPKSKYFKIEKWPKSVDWKTWRQVRKWTLEIILAARRLGLMIESSHTNDDIETWLHQYPPILKII